MDTVFSMIHYLIGRSRIKYTILDEIFHSVYIPKENHLVFHVDASSILYRLYREKDLDTIQSVSYDVAVKDLVISLIIFTFFRHGSPSDPKPAISPVTKYIFLSRDIRISVSKSFIVSIVNGCTGLGIQIISLLRF